jgi:hypothetical protein
VDSLSKDRLDALPLPKAWAALADPQSNGALFDHVCKSPAGQLAPLSFRATYVARNLIFAAHAAAGVCVLLALGFGGSSIRASMQAQSDRQQAEASLTRVSADIAAADKSLETFGVSPDLVRSALAVDAREISSAPGFAEDMQRLSVAITSVAGARIKNLQWDVLESNAVACAGEGGATPAPAEAVSDAAPEAAPDAAPLRKVQLQLALQLSDELGPRQRMQRAESVTRALAALKGATVMRDPARALRDGDIRMGATTAAAAESADLNWCAVLSPVTGKTAVGDRP